MDSTSLGLSVKGQCIITLCLRGHEYKDIAVSILPDLCSNIIVGHDTLKRHSSLQVTFCGEEAPLDICSVAVANVEPVQLFTYLSPDCKPISIKLLLINQYLSEKKTSHTQRLKQADNSINSHVFLLVFEMEFRHFNEYCKR
ncbi:hypothetical protein PR048_026760 [Dryococelus australis]|uniref:Uncharacterized protein n=1 Tax=Dryococelus australis TaxID=614101 RepID=A0ABQ9GMA4_9NEOP|nr:hypothetical protein PR048_026760 [Dryococelus australis]